MIARENDFVLSILLDAHASNESVKFILNVMEDKEKVIKQKLNLPLKRSNG